MLIVRMEVFPGSYIMKQELFTKTIILLFSVFSLIIIVAS